MNRPELLQKCKELGIKGVSAKNKSEIIQIIKEKEEENEKGKEQPFQIVGVVDQNINEVVIENILLTTVLSQLLIQTPKDKHRKVCKQCNEIGHGVSSLTCKINKDKNDKLKQKIKTYILSKDCLEDRTIDDYCDDLSELLEITPNLCKSLYNEISPLELLDRQINVELYLTELDNSSKKCNECDKTLYCIQTNTNHIWKGNNICDVCWCKYADYRNSIWENIKIYKSIQCSICSSIQSHNEERYHYDHLNMFNKDKSICSMINEGFDIEDVYNEIDKCQILCLSCHHKVTDIERKIGFTRMKMILTKSLNQNEITPDEYIAQTVIYQNLYEEKMKSIYAQMKSAQY